MTGFVLPENYIKNPEALLRKKWSRAASSAIKWWTVPSTNEGKMEFVSSVSERPRALVCSTTSMEESMGPMPLTEHWLRKPFDKGFAGLQRSKTPLSWLEHVKFVSFLNGRFTSLLKR